MPRVSVRLSTDAQAVRVRAGTVTLVPQIPFPGAADVPAGTQNAAIAHLAETRPTRDEVAYNAQLAGVYEAVENAQNAISGFEGQLGGLNENQTGIRRDLDEAIGDLANVNVSALQSITLVNNVLTLTYADGSTKTANFRLPKGYRGELSAAPTAAGELGDYYRNVNPALDLIEWVCTVGGNAAGGAAPVAVWTARGGKSFAPMVFDVDANRNYHHQAPSAWVMEAPVYYGALAASNVVWEYTAALNWTGWAAVGAWPLNMAAWSTLRARVTGLASGAAGGATLRRLS